MKHSLTVTDVMSKQYVDGRPLARQEKIWARQGVELSRANWPLIDSKKGAQVSAAVYSIVETAKANQLKPYEYLKCILTEMSKHMDDTEFSFLDDLRPWANAIPAICRK